MNEMKKGAGIQSLQIGLSIVDLVATHGQPITFTEISESTGITKSNLYKYLSTLTNMGILYRDKFSGLYELGSKLIEYGMNAISQENVIDRVTPYLYEINKELKETILFSIWTHNGPMVVKFITSNKTLNIGAQIGTCLPLHSSTGKICAAFMDGMQITQWVEKELSEKSEEQKQNFFKELYEIKEKPLAFSNEPIVSSISSLAFPILNFNRDLLGVITVVGFKESMLLNFTEKVTYILRKNHEISQMFGSKQ
jgi:DNA-binding IclR family transcriptional regulator